MGHLLPHDARFGFQGSAKHSPKDTRGLSHTYERLQSQNFGALAAFRLSIWCVVREY